MNRQPSLGKLAINCRRYATSHGESVLGFWDGWICGSCYRKLTHRGQVSPMEMKFTLRYDDWLHVVRGETPHFMRFVNDGFFKAETTELEELKRWANISRVAILYRPERAVEQLYLQGFATVPIDPVTPGEKRRLRFQVERARIAEVLRDDAKLSDHTVARKAEVHPATVAKTRHVLELRGEIPRITKRMGKDGRVWSHK